MSRSRRNVNVQAPTGSQLASIVTSGEQPTTMSSVNTTDVVESELLECETNQHIGAANNQNLHAEAPSFESTGNTNHNVIVSEYNNNISDEIGYVSSRQVPRTQFGDICQLVNDDVERQHGREQVKHPTWNIFSKKEWAKFFQLYKTYVYQGGSLRLQQMCGSAVLIGLDMSLDIGVEAWAGLPAAEAIQQVQLQFGISDTYDIYQAVMKVKMEDTISIEAFTNYVSRFQAKQQEVGQLQQIPDELKCKAFVRGLSEHYNIRSKLYAKLSEGKNHSYRSIVSYTFKLIQEVESAVTLVQEQHKKVAEKAKESKDRVSHKNDKSTGDSTNKSTKVDKTSNDSRVLKSSTDKVIICFNCGKNHVLSDCKEPFDDEKIKAAKQKSGWKPKSDGKTTTGKVAMVSNDPLSSKCNSSNVATHIDVSVVNTDICGVALVDTGATVAIVSPDMAERLRKCGVKSTYREKRVQVANGNLVTTNEVMEVYLSTVGDERKKFMVNAWVMECCVDFLLDVKTCTDVGLVILTGQPSTVMMEEKDYINTVCMWPDTICNIYDDGVSKCDSHDPNVFVDMPCMEKQKLAERVKESVHASPIQDRIESVILQYVTVFDGDLSKPALVEEFEIKLEPGTVIPYQPNRPMAPSVLAVVKEQVAELLRMGIIRESSSTTVSPIVLVSSAGKKRMCVDYRLLNACTVPNRYPVRNVRDVLERVKGSKYFATIDLQKGYHQIQVSDICIPLTAFNVPWGTFEYCRLPFGVRNGPAAFQHVMDKVFAGKLYSGIEVFVDDILIHSDNEEEFLKLLEYAMQKMAEFNLKANLGKSSFGYTNIDYIGYHIDAEGFEVTKKHQEAIARLEEPTTKSEVRKINGLFNYFRIFVENFAWICKPLYKAAAGTGILVWTEECHEAFECIKRKMTQKCKLFYIDDKLPLYLATDASKVGVGGVLYQVSSDEVRYIVFVSMAFNETQQNWSVIEQEGFAVYFSIIQCEKYIGCMHFILQTDHNNLRWMEKSVVPKMIRWRLRLQEFNYEVEYITGKSNVIADALSRLPCIAVAAMVDENMDDLEKLAENKEYVKLIHLVHGNTIGHRSAKHTVKLLKEMGIEWDGMQELATEVIKGCPSCQKLGKHMGNSGENTNFHIEASEPFQKICIDTMGPLDPDKGKNQYVVVIIDVFTRYIELFACKGATSKEAAECLVKVFGRYGLPETVVSDNGTQYVNTMMSQLYDMCSIDSKRCTPYRHQGNGIVERVNYEIMQQLRHIIFHKDVKDNWSKYLSVVQYIINSTTHSSIGMSPMELVYGGGITRHRGLLKAFRKEMNINYAEYVIDLDKSLQKVSEVVRKYNELKNTEQNQVVDVNKYVVGQKVLMRVRGNRNKLLCNWTGPYIITNVKRRTLVVKHLNNENKYERVDMDSVKMYNPEVGDEVISEERLAAKDKHLYIVEEVLSHKGDLKNLKSCAFEVKWEGYDGTTWEPYHNLRNNVSLQKYLETMKKG